MQHTQPFFSVTCRIYLSLPGSPLEDIVSYRH